MFDPRYQALLPFLSQERQQKFNDVLQNRTRRLCLVLENVYQSRNASAVMRTCDGLGIQDVHLIENINPWVFNRGVSKGAPTWLTLHRYREQFATRQCIHSLKANGYRLAVTSPHVDGYEAHNLPTDEPIALVMGTEFKGVSDEFLAEADYHVYIPMIGFAESLNISVAAGMIMGRILENIRIQPKESWKLDEQEMDDLRTEWAIKSVRKAPKLLQHLGIDPVTGQAIAK